LDRRHAEALPMPSGYFALILRGHGSTRRGQAALLEGTEVSPATLTAGSEITLGQQLRQLRNAERWLEPGWGLAVGSRLSAATHGPNGFAAVSATTMRQGIEVVTRYAHLRAPHFRFRSLVTPARECRIVFEDHVALSDAERRVMLELVMLSTQELIEVLLGRPMCEGRFEFPYPVPEYGRSYADAFHAPARFGCQEAAVVIPAPWLSVESPFADPILHRASLERLHVSARRLDGDRLLVARVEQVLAQRGARLGLRQVARLLGISDRTLTRRLGGQETSFQTLAEESLKNRAVVLLQDEELSVAEVAYTLGYQDAANFGRAFRRWFGESPGKYRSMARLPG
jgi:AraC-like DNA-binding protein